MRRPFLLILASLSLAACAKSETASTDSAAMAPGGPAALTAADLDGTWSGVSMAETSDSVTSRWTAMRGATEHEVKLVLEGSKDTVVFTRTLDADSTVATSAPYKPTTPPNSPMVVTRSVGRLSGGKLVGTSVTMLASKPDSVLSRGRWEATRVP
jgi:hypothetical protein